MIDDIKWEHTFTARMPMRYRVSSWIRKHTLCRFGQHRVMRVDTIIYEGYVYSTYSYCLDCDWEGSDV